MLTVTGADLVWTGTRRLRADVVCGEQVLQLVTPGDSPPVGGELEPFRTLDATGCVVTPGLVNAHHHLLQTAFRTLPAARHRPMRDWLAVMAAAYRRAGIDAALSGAAAAVGLAESLLCGVTTVSDHHLTWPPGGEGLGGTVANDRDMALATAAAAAEVGARLCFTYGTAGASEERAAAAAGVIAEALKPLNVDVAVGPAGVHSDGPDVFAALAAVAKDLGLRRRTQANEQIDLEVAAATYGGRPLDVLGEWGWLAPDVTLAHLCDVTSAEVDVLAAHGVSATHAPGCDLVQGWGVSPIGELRSKCVAVGIGTSGGGSNDAGHLLADARLAMQVAPLTGFPLTATDVLTMATRGSADGLGRPDLGSLEVGAAGDLVCWDVSGAADAGVADLLEGLIWASPGRRPRHVVVAGRVVVQDGELVSTDERTVVMRLKNLLAERDMAPKERQ